MSKETLINGVRAVIKNAPAAQIRGTKLADKLEEIIEACFNSSSEIVEVAASRALALTDVNKVIVVTAEDVTLTTPADTFSPLDRITVFPAAGTKIELVPGSGFEVETLFQESGLPELIDLVYTGSNFSAINGSLFDTSDNKSKTTLKYLFDKVSKAAIYNTAVPTTAGSTGTAGQIALDANYLYVCVATDTWTRIALAW